MTTQATWLAKLRLAATERDAAKVIYDRRCAAVRNLIRDANDAGVPMTEVAKAAGVARTRAHRIKAKTPTT